MNSILSDVQTAKWRYYGGGALVALLLLVYHHRFAYLGHFGFDDVMGYMHEAAKLLDGSYTLENNHYAYRWGMIMLTALSYKIWGIQDAAGAVAPILITLATALLILKVLRRYIWPVGGLAMMVYLLDQWTLFYSDKVMPDILIAALGLGGFAVVWHCRYRKPDSEIWHGLALAVMLWLAFVSKETIILQLPVFFMLFCRDMYFQKFRTFWLASLGWAILLLGAYLFFIYVKTGNPWQRFTAIEMGSYFNPCSYDQLPISHLLRRIGYGLWRQLTSSGMVLCMALAGPALIALARRKIAGEERFWAAVLAGSLVSANFMTTSYKAYVPMCSEDIRHFLYLAPLAAICAGPVLAKFWTTMENGRSLALILAILTGIAAYCGYQAVAMAAGGLLGAVIGRYVWGERVGLVAWGFGLAVVVSLAIPGWRAGKYARSVNYVGQRDLVYRNFGMSEPVKTLVLTNRVQGNLGLYYMGYDTTRLRFVDFGKVSQKQIASAEEVYVLSNGYTRYLAQEAWEDLPMGVREFASGKQVGGVQEVDREGDVVLYRVAKQVVAPK